MDIIATPTNSVRDAGKPTPTPTPVQGPPSPSGPPVSGDFLYHPYPVEGGSATVEVPPAASPDPSPSVSGPDFATNVAVTSTLTGRIYTTDTAGVGHGIPLRMIRKLTRNIDPTDPAYGDMAGGSGVPHTSELLPIPAWSQLIDDYPNKSEHPARDMYATTDCGSQCSAMSIYSARGVELPEGIIRDYISDCVGGLDQGLTTAQDLVAYMRSPHVNFRNARWVQQPWPQVQRTLQEELAARRLVLILGHWYVGTLHWEVARWYDVYKGLKTNNPWDGGLDYVTWQDYANRINTGILVLTGEEAHYG